MRRGLHTGLRPRRERPIKGFTLIEVLVGLAIVALVSLMSWRGLDGMLRSQERLRERGQALARLQTALAQWTLDLQQAAETPYLNAITWDGRQLRIVRRAASEDALVVVAWGTRAPPQGEGLLWRRWQSAPVRDRTALLKAWNEAPEHLAELGDASRAVTLLPVQAWTLQVEEGAGWTDPPVLSAQAVAGADPPLIDPPEALRLRLQLPAEAGLAGALQLDWANPEQNRGRL